MNAPKEDVDPADHTVGDRVREARALYREYKGVLLDNPQVSELLNRVAGGVAASREVMLRGGVVAACRWCEEEAGGSCCGAGIENRYGAHLLLMNLLLGAVLPDRRARTESCYFLGESGCLLKARHVLCVNYLCEKLRRDLAPDVLRALEVASGVELETGFLLHEVLKKLTRV